MAINILFSTWIIALLAAGSGFVASPAAWPANWFAIPQQGNNNLLCVRSIGIHSLNPHYDKFGIPSEGPTHDMPADLSGLIVAVRRAQETIVAEMGADSAVWTRSDIMLVGDNGRSVVLHQPHLKLEDGREQHVQRVANEMAPQPTTLLHYSPDGNESANWHAIQLGMCRPGTVQLYGKYVVIYEDQQYVGRVHRVSDAELIAIELPDAGILRSIRFAEDHWTALSDNSIMFGTVEENRMNLTTAHNLPDMDLPPSSLPLGSLQNSFLLGISEDGSKALLSNLCRVNQAGNLVWIGDNSMAETLGVGDKDLRWNLYGYSTHGSGDSYALIRQREHRSKAGDHLNTKYWLVKIDRDFDRAISWQLPLPDVDAPIAVSPCGTALLVLSQSRKARLAISRPVAWHCIEWGRSLQYIGIGRSSDIGWYVPRQ